MNTHSSSRPTDSKQVPHCFQRVARNTQATHLFLIHYEAVIAEFSGAANTSKSRAVLRSSPPPPPPLNPVGTPESVPSWCHRHAFARHATYRNGRREPLGRGAGQSLMNSMRCWHRSSDPQERRCGRRVYFSRLGTVGLAAGGSPSLSMGQSEPVFHRRFGRRRPLMRHCRGQFRREAGNRHPCVPDFLSMTSRTREAEPDGRVFKLSVRQRERPALSSPIVRKST